MVQFLRKNGIILSYLFFVFIILFTFFTKVHTLVLYDGDDWVNLTYIRKAIPLWGSWNPIKILPEILFPLVGSISAYAVMPFTGDYVFSVTLTSALVLSLIITIYTFMFIETIKNLFNLDEIKCLSLSFIFLLFHFLIFKHNHTNNTFLFWSANLTCVFHYLIPALFNICLVLYFWKNNITGRCILSKKTYINGLLILTIYLAIFSNILNSIIFIAFLSSLILTDMNKENFSIKTLKNLIFENKFFLTIIFIWLLSLIFEANGGRAHQIGKSIFELPLYKTGTVFIKAMLQMNKSFFAMGICIIGFAEIIFFRVKEMDEVSKIYLRSKKIIFLSAFITFVYLLLVCAKTGGGYMGRSDVLIDLIFWLLLYIMFSIAYILNKYPKLFLLIPVYILFVTMLTLDGSKSYRETNMGNLNPNICIAVDKDLMNQIISADKEMKKEMVLVVPKGNNIDNWPHPMYMGKNISKTLFRHGIISKQLKIEIKPDTKMNEKYSIPIK